MGRDRESLRRLGIRGVFLVGLVGVRVQVGVGVRSGVVGSVSMVSMVLMGSMELTGWEEEEEEEEEVVVVVGSVVLAVSMVPEPVPVEWRGVSQGVLGG